MTIRTTIPYHHGEQFADHTGPLLCDRCKRSLIDRSPDAKEDSVDHATNAELVLYVWESEVDAMGHALCFNCAEDDEQAAAYMELAKWRNRAENRGYYSGRDGVTVYEGQVQGPTFSLTLGKISSHAVFTFTGRDPLKIQPGLGMMRRFGLLEAEDPFTDMAEKWQAFYQEQAEVVLELAKKLQLPVEFGHTWNDADELQLGEECPKTERNV